MEDQCEACGNLAVAVLTTKVDGEHRRTQYFCAKCWVQREGEACLDAELTAMEIFCDYDSMHPEVAKEIGRRFPALARKHGRALRKIVCH